jgi:hypothetical protein
MRETFDIFLGTFDGDYEWIEPVVGTLFDAQARMREIAAENPGSYFVFSASRNEVVAKIETVKASSACG